MEFNLRHVDLMCLLFFMGRLYWVLYGIIRSQKTDIKMTHDGIGLCVANIDIILGSMINAIGKDYSTI